MKTKIFMIALTVFLSGWLGSYAQGGDGWQQTANGLKYKIIVKDKKETKKPVIGDMVTVSAFYKTKDTIFWDSRKMMTPYIFPISESTYKGDIFEGLQLMTIGDSAVFQLNGDSLFFKSFRVKALPKYIPPGTVVEFYVKLLKMQPKEEFQKEMQAKFEAESKKAAVQNAKEDSILKAYAKKNNYTVEPSKSGLYYIETKKGEGPNPESGKTVKVHYTGKLMDGTIFDSSVSRGEPFSFPLGKNKVIRGWEEGIAKMNKGTKAILLIPSRLGYGEGNMGKIPAYSILIFEVELIDFQ